MQLPVVGAGLLLVERVLRDELGPPARQLHAVRHLGAAWAEPVASMVALMALAAEVLVAYVLVVLLLRSISMSPGPVGRLATRLTCLVAPVAVRRALDLLVGGTLLAQTALGGLPAASPGLRPGSAETLAAAAATNTGSSAPASLIDGALDPASSVDRVEPAGTRPTSRRSAVPLPPWLGGGPSKAGDPPPPSTTTEPGSGDTRTPSTTDLPGSGNAGRAPVAAPGRRDAQATPGRGAGAQATPGPSAGTKPTPAPSAGGRAARVHTVAPHDTLWDIAASHLAPAERSAATIHRYWQQVYRANRRAIGADPDLIHPGTRLDVPPYRAHR